jgi:hypothetical protein
MSLAKFKVKEQFAGVIVLEGFLNFELFLGVVLGFELRAFILSHSTSPIFVKGFSR